MKRAKLPKGIRKLRAGYQLDVRDSQGKRHRPKFATREEADAALDQIMNLKAGGEFLATASNTDFGHALDLLLNRPKKLALASKLRVESIVNGHIRPALGARKLSEFPAQRMSFVKSFLAEKAQDYATASVAHMHSAIKLALDLAIEEGIMGAPNPMTTFKVGVPEGTETSEREVLTLDEIAKLVGSAMVRAKREHELAFASRFVLTMLGLFTGFRNQECSGLYWDCVDFDGRVISMRRIWRKGEGIVPTSKTGKGGFRDIPMSPMLHAVLLAYADRLRAMGHKLEGPVLRTDRAGIVLPGAIMGDHWPAIAEKAGFVEGGALRHTFYALRHTAANMWRAIGLDLLDLKEFMGHYDIATTSAHYLHVTPHFRVLQREVEALGLGRSREALIDGLGIVLARRWRDEGIDIPCSPPASHSTALRIGYEGDDQLAIEGNGQTIDLRPNAVALISPDAAVDPFSLEALRARQRAFCKEKAAEGWKFSRIAKAVGLDSTTVSTMVRGACDQMWLRKVGRVERHKLHAEAIRMRTEQDMTNAEIGLALKVSPSRIAIWLRGHPMKQWRRASQTYGPHEALIRRRLSEGAKVAEIAREIGAPSSSGVHQFARRLGILPSQVKDGTA